MQDLLIRVFGFPAKLRLLKSHAPSREPPDEVRRGRHRRHRVRSQVTRGHPPDPPRTVASGTSKMRPASRRRVGNEIVLALSGKWPMSVVNPSIMPKVPMERWQPYPMGRGPNR